MLARHESEQRIINLQKKLKQKELDGALIIYPIDIYYFSGTRQNSILWIPAEGKAVLLVRKSVARALEESLIEDTRPIQESRELRTLLNDRVTKVGLTYDVIPVQQYEYYSRLLSGVQFVDISAVVRNIRSVKSDWELEQMKKSGESICGVFKQVRQFLKAGMREIDLAAEFEYRLRKAGGEGYTRMRAFNQELFQGLAVAGKSAGAPGFFDGPVTGRGLSSASPHGASKAVINREDPVLLDYTGAISGYLVDMARTHVIGGLSSDFKHAFDTSISIQRYLTDNLKPGVMCDELFAAALNMADRAGLRDNFMGVPGENAKFVGHGVGLELDELPVIAQGYKVSLQSGQTIAIEPKFVFPDRGAVGIENTFVVSHEGGVKITNLADGIVYLYL